MTVGVVIKCNEGIVLACDSLATFGRGVSISKYQKKIHTLDREEFVLPVSLIGAGAGAFVDKFLYRMNRGGLAAARERYGRPLDIIDFAEGVCENLVTVLFKEYEIDRRRFLETPVPQFNLMLIFAGMTHNGNLRAFIAYPDGLTENIDLYGTIGSGAAYAELFLRDLGFVEEEIDLVDATGLAVYAVQGAAIMDPNVGGTINVLMLRPDQGGMIIQPFEDAEALSKKAKLEIYALLHDMGINMRKLVRGESTLKKLKLSK